METTPKKTRRVYPKYDGPAYVQVSERLCTICKERKPKEQYKNERAMMCNDCRADLPNRKMRAGQTRKNVVLAERRNARADRGGDNYLRSRAYLDWAGTDYGVYC